MDRQINVKESYIDGKSWFNIKKFQISGTKFERPVKALDAKNLVRPGSDFQGPCFQILETSESVKHDAMYSLIDRIAAQKPRLEHWGHGMRTVINITLDSSPPLDSGYKRYLDEFSDLYNRHSELLASVPNIRLERGEHAQKTVDDYLEFVDAAFEMLNNGSKPVFVPVSLRMHTNEVKHVCDHYLHKGYLNFWVDFDGSPIGMPELLRLRSLYELLLDREQFGNAVFYHTNIRREGHSNPWYDQNPASDVLAPLAGANIVGVNREPPGITPDPDPRILDRDTYYYHKTDDKGHRDKSTNVTYNAIQLANEFQSQAETFERESTVIGMGREKALLKTDHVFFNQLTDRSAGHSPGGWF